MREYNQTDGRKERMIKGYIFDYGGTLDTGGNHWGKVLWHSYVKNHVLVKEEDFRTAYVYAERALAANRIIQPASTFRDTLSKKIQLQMRSLNENCGLENTETLQAKVLDDVYSFAKNNTAHSAKVLKQIKKQCPIVLVSNFYGNIKTVLQEFGFDGLFGGIVESATAGVRKPDPMIFTLGVEKLGIRPSETMVVGDSYDKDIIPAAKAGCMTTWIKGEGWTEDDVENPIADRIIHDLSELL